MKTDGNYSLLFETQPAFLNRRQILFKLKKMVVTDKYVIQNVSHLTPGSTRYAFP